MTAMMYSSLMMDSSILRNPVGTIFFDAVGSLYRSSIQMSMHVVSYSRSSVSYAAGVHLSTDTKIVEATKSQSGLPSEDPSASCKLRELTQPYSFGEHNVMSCFDDS